MLKKEIEKIAKEQSDVNGKLVAMLKRQEARTHVLTSELKQAEDKNETLTRDNNSKSQVVARLTEQNMKLTNKLNAKKGKDKKHKGMRY